MFKKALLLSITGIGIGFAFLSASTGSESKTDVVVAEASKEAEAAYHPTQDEINKLSEAFGHLIGSSLETPGLTFNLESIIKGMIDATQGKEAPMPLEDYEQLMVRINEAAWDQMAQDNLNAANTFLVENGQKEGIVELTPQKLQYEVLEEGTGAEVVEHTTPLINYTGTYIDGSVFGSTNETGGPIDLSLDHTIPGFQQAVVGMKEGEKRRIYIHPDLAYGTNGHLDPNALLTFEVEIIRSNAELASVEEEVDSNTEAQTEEIAETTIKETTEKLVTLETENTE